MTIAVEGLPNPRDLERVAPENAYLLPRGLVSGPVAPLLAERGQAFILCGQARAFTALEFIVRADGAVSRFASSVTAFDPWRHVLPVHLRDRVEAILDALIARRASFAGLAQDRPLIMGIVNVTPDSFSDGGDHDTPDAAISHALTLVEAGADILDVGGESTRPGAQPVSPDEEQKRVLPVIKAVADKGVTVSVDTRHAATMAAAVSHGASIVNDVTALTGDADALQTVCQADIPVVLMHMQGEPQTMQTDPTYQWAPIDIFDYLSTRLNACRDAGIDQAKLCIDPGIGFGKSDAHNRDLFDALTLFHGLGVPVLLGASRKSFIGRLSGTATPKARVPGSLTAALAGMQKGVQIFRVHDVAETRQAFTIAEAIQAEA